MTRRQRSAPPRRGATGERLVTFGLAMASLMAGCAGEAILEATLTLPAATPCAARFVAVEALLPSGGCPFSSEWAGGDRVVLDLAGTPSELALSVVAAGADVERTLCLRVRPCAARDSTLCDPGARFEVEAPFYRGRYTRVRLAVDPAALCEAGAPQLIDRCEVAGCTDEVGLSSYCDADDRHRCQ